MEYQWLSNKTPSQKWSRIKINHLNDCTFLPFIFHEYHKNIQTHIIKRLLIDHQRTRGNVFYMTFLPSWAESQSENKTDTWYLPITLIHSTPSIVRSMNVFSEQVVNKNAIIKGNTRLKIIGFILTTSSFRLSLIPVECLIFCNFNCVIC